MRRAFVFDQEKCMACNTCTVACKDGNNVNPGPVRWRKQYTHEKGASITAGASTDKFFLPFSMSCNHCAQPACQKVCGAGAIIKRPDGIVYVDRKKCIEIKNCLSACPFAAAQQADSQQEPEGQVGWSRSHPMQKCDFCKDRLDRGEKPICVEACPVFALDAGDYDEMTAKYASMGITLEPLTRADFPYAYKNTDESTQPSMLIHKRKAQIIIKTV